MKKLVLTSVCTLAVAGGALAQGTINWSGPANGSYTTQTNSQTYSPLFGGGPAPAGGSIGLTGTATGSYYFELLYTAYTGSGNGTAGSIAPQPTTLAQLATWSDAGIGGANSTTVAGRNVVATANAAQVVPWANGTTDSIMLVEWSANLGTTWTSALAALQADVTPNAFVGLSQTGYINPNVAPAGGPAIFGSGSNANGYTIANSTSTQLYLVPVPEPSTIAMAAFGGLSLLALRRKK